MRTLIVLSILVLVVAGCAKFTPQAGNASLNRKESLRYMNQVSSSLGELSKTLPASRSLRQKAEAYRTTTKQIVALDERGVEKEFIEHGIDVCAWCRDFAAVWERADVLERRWVQTQQHFESLDAAGEAFLRGMAGDPFGKFNESLAANRELQAEFEEIRRDMQKMLSRFDQLTTQAQRLQSKLK